jgi:chorismate mutase
MHIQKLREKISKYDAQITALIAKRQSLMPAVGLYKKQNNIAINQPAREKEILIKIHELAEEHDLSPVMLEKIFKTLFKDAKERQTKI